MTLHARDGGVWKPVQNLYIRQSGVWVPVQTAQVRDSGVWKIYYQSEIVVRISTSRNSLTVGNPTTSEFFTAADWVSGKNKRLIIDQGVTISSNQSWGALAIQGGHQGNATWGGRLIIENNGNILGLSGAANGGVGGKALYDEDTNADFTKKAIFINNGGIFAGGGGGGQGGPGSYTVTTYDPPSGDYFNEFSPHFMWVARWSASARNITWNGSLIGTPSGSGETTYDGPDGYRYYRGAFRKQPDGSMSYYGISRSSNTTAGSTGGSGGRGQGSDAAQSAGSAGGTNAGTGGTGGGWGSNGSAGAPGNAGSGAAGGLAGIAYRTGLFDMVNNGTIQGRVR